MNCQHRPTSGHPHAPIHLSLSTPSHKHMHTYIYLPSRGEDLSMSLHPVRKLSCPKVLNLPYQTTSLHQTPCYRPNSCSHGRLYTAGEETIHRKVMNSLNGLQVLQAPRKRTCDSSFRMTASSYRGMLVLRNRAGKPTFAQNGGVKDRPPDIVTQRLPGL